MALRRFLKYNKGIQSLNFLEPDYEATPPANVFVESSFSWSITAFFGINFHHAAPGITEFERVLKAGGGFTDEEIESLRKGEPVSKLQQSKNDREVSVIGVSAFTSGFENALETLQDVIRRQNKGSLMQMGNFGQVPAFADLEQLAIEETDLRDLGNCRVGKCNSIKLDAAMIERFQREVDWNSAEGVLGPNGSTR